MHNGEHVRRLEVIEVHSDNTFTVSFKLRGHGETQERVSHIYLIQPWEPYKAEQTARRETRKHCSQLQDHLWKAMRGAGMVSGMPYVYSEDVPVSIYLASESAEIVIQALSNLASQDSQSSLERIFG
jgi:hypothetical protein